ncbi:Proteasome, subunit alpha/beta [Sesbania bispinosa]|nr:Proteasome, subunit alpha/beta [Sesbania bispinosa]
MEAFSCGPINTVKNQRNNIASPRDLQLPIRGIYVTYNLKILERWHLVIVVSGFVEDNGFKEVAWSPSGKLVQIEHALTAVGSGQTSLGIKAANGVVIATEKKLPSILVDEASVQKIQLLTPNIGVVYSGMGPDFRVLVRKSRKQAEQYHRLYKEPIPVTQLVREVAAVMQEFTQSGGVRPFGVSLLVAGFDDNGPQLYQVDPSGSYFSWKASAMGKNVSNAKTFLEKRYTDDMELDDAVHTAILTLKEGFEGQISGKNIEIGIIGADKKFRVLTPAEIDDYLGEVE